MSFTGVTNVLTAWLASVVVGLLVPDWAAFIASFITAAIVSVALNVFLNPVEQP